MHDHQPCAVGKALGRADVAEQDDRYANLEAQLVGDEAGRVAGVEVFGGVSLRVCRVGDFICRGVDELFSWEGRNGLVIEDIEARSGVCVWVMRGVFWCECEGLRDLSRSALSYESVETETKIS